MLKVLAAGLRVLGLAPLVDGVLATQVKRLKAYAETGRPSEQE